MAAVEPQDSATSVAPPGRRRQVIWLLCAAVPAGLLSAVTALITTDLISAPLLWVGPLAIYLGSFVVAFSARGRRVLWVIEWLVPAAVTLLWIPYVYPDGRWPLAGLLLVLFGSYAVLATAIHGRLAADRPDERYLTRFYLTLAAGGMLATAVVAVVAPLVFSNIYEYPILVVASAATLAMLPGPARTARRGIVGFGLDAGLRLAPYVVIIGLLALQMWASDAVDRMPVRVLLAGGAVVAIAARPSVLAVGTAALLLVLALAPATPPLHQQRTFFGVLEVRTTPGGDAHIENSGTTLHGAQLLGERRREPTSYYVEAGPVGDVFDDLRTRTDGASIGVVGLGVGTIAAYAEPGDSLAFYEIDQATIDIATDSRYFSYLADAVVDARPRPWRRSSVPGHRTGRDLRRPGPGCLLVRCGPGPSPDEGSHGDLRSNASSRRGHGLPSVEPLLRPPAGRGRHREVAGIGRRSTEIRAGQPSPGAPAGELLLGRHRRGCQRVHRRWLGLAT